MERSLHSPGDAATLRQTDGPGEENMVLINQQARADRLDWSRTSNDYLKHRPGYPAHFFSVLQALGVGLPGQDILDLGAGTGALSVPFATQGSRVVAVDSAEGQLEAARSFAAERGVSVRTLLARAEETSLPSASFDVVSASMCWNYFELDRMEPEVKRLLRRHGKLVVTSLIWLSDGPIAQATDELLEKHNSKARGTDKVRLWEPVPAWSVNRFQLRTFHTEAFELPFTHESWRGRLRASKWIDADLSADKARAFDREHAALLERIAPSTFPIAHRATVHIFEV